MSGEPAPRVELARLAVKDLRALDKQDRDRATSAITHLATGGANLDVKPLAGHAPWRRLRAGELRVLYRPLDGPASGILIARVIHRRELDRAVKRLAT